MPAQDLDTSELASFFKALGDETRVRIVALLAHGELCGCHFEHALELPQSTVSRQLKVLKTAGIVSARRDGTWMHYRLAEQADPERKIQLEGLIRSFGRRPDLKNDVKRLVRTRGPGKCT